MVSARKEGKYRLGNTGSLSSWSTRATLGSPQIESEAGWASSPRATASHVSTSLKSRAMYRTLQRGSRQSLKRNALEARGKTFAESNELSSTLKYQYPHLFESRHERSEHQTSPLDSSLSFKSHDALAIADKDWSEIGISVYRVGVGMYHSSIAVDNVEWHFWEGVGVQGLQRYFDGTQGAIVSISHVPLVEYVPIDTLTITPKAIAALCLELGSSMFSMHTYDILRCNCNHFTAGVLQRLGLDSKMPLWINRLATATDNLCTVLPFVRTWINTLLNPVPHKSRLPSSPSYPLAEPMSSGVLTLEKSQKVLPKIISVHP